MVINGGSPDEGFVPFSYLDTTYDSDQSAGSDEEDSMDSLGLELPPLPDHVWLRLLADAMDPDAPQMPVDLVPDPSTESLDDGSGLDPVDSGDDQPADGDHDPFDTGDDPDDGGLGNGHHDPAGLDQLGAEHHDEPWLAGHHDFADPAAGSFDGGDANSENTDPGDDHGWLS